MNTIDPEVSMDSRKLVFQETAIVAIGQVICVGAMFGIFALLGSFDRTVLLGGIIGALLSLLNFLFMAVGALMAADKAVNQNVNGGKATIKTSYLVRMVLLAVVLFAFAKSGLCNVVALVLPLAFVRPILTIAEFFRKPGEANQ